MAGNWWWGRSVIVDLHGCEKSLLKDPEVIRRFTRELCELLKMKRVGPVQLKRFGHGKLRGYSVVQFIETSTIVCHFDEHGDRSFIDVFSCKKYNPEKVAFFCKNFFNANDASMYVEERV